ncbi:hypothetical protein PQX77_009689 [Marasmius sp. AFHP31]|nr:hypothetical protein PQX77_009689 [Marasmius sp. AFHP31]
MVPESHFTSVLHTNYVPSSKELKELHHLVLEPQEQIRKLDEEMKRLQTQRDELQRFVNSHRALAAPFRRLPADIWGEIFVYCLPKNQLNVAVCTVKEAPLMLTTICRTWREVALNTPRLWNSVHIFSTGQPVAPFLEDRSPRELIYEPTQPKVLHGIKLWLDRSGSLPLTLSVHIVETALPMSPSEDLSDQETEVTSTNLLEIMDLLAEYSRRWKTLSLGPGVNASHQRSFSQLTAEDIPLLETVYTGDMNLFSDFPLPFPLGPWNNIPPQTAIPNPAPMADLISKGSLLRSLHLQQGSISTLRIPLGWCHLTELSFDFQPFDTSDPSSSPCVPLQTIAQTCRSLTVLTFRADLRGLHGVMAGGSLNDPVEWTSLRELNISLNGFVCDYAIPEDGPHTIGFYSFPPYLKTIYGTIIAPQLLRLSVQLGHHRLGDRAPTSDDTLPFHTLVKGSPHLTSLRICGYHILKPEALAGCLQSSSSLKSLVLQPGRFPTVRRPVGATGYPTGEELITVISPSPNWIPRLLSSLSSLDLCPQLESLDVGRCGESNNLSSILEFVQLESRITSLKHIKGDMGELRGEQTRALTSNESLIERLRAVHGTSIDLKWKEADPPSQYQRNRNPRIGLPDHTYDF